MSRQVPDYCDARARQFFRQGYDGTPGGTYRFNTRHPLLRETKTLNGKICCYCGNRALPIQAGLRDIHDAMPLSLRSEYEVTGYTCCCKDAMDEYDFHDKLKALEKRHQSELQELLRTVPEQNKEVIEQYVKDSLLECQERIVYDLQRDGKTNLKFLEFNVTSTYVNRNWWQR